MEIQKNFKELLKSLKTHKVVFVIVGMVSCLLLSCQQQTTPTKPKSTDKDKIFLTLDFKQGKALRYKFVSSRDITIKYNPEDAPLSTDGTASKSSESLEIVVAYTPVKVDPYGLTTINATCESVLVKRSDGSQTDAVKYLEGKKYSFTVKASGQIENNSQLNELLKQAGEKAFTAGTGSERTKEQDMLGDYIATQWFLWDSISSIPKAAQGVRIGHSWQSKLSVPTPMVSRLARNVTYKLDKTSQNQKDGLVLIISSFSKADSVPESWPVPYSGRFMVKGKFGLLGGYKLLDIAGHGEELFNVDSGCAEQYSQQYQLKLQASVMGLSVNPEIVIEQNLTMKIIE